MDEITGLLEELARLGVKLAAEDGRLRLTAAPGALTGGLQQRVLANRDEILRRLGAVGSAPPPAAHRLVAAPHQDGVPFPLSDLQLGFYMASDPDMEYHVRPHFYLEFDRRGLDVAAYEAAWNRVLARHRRELCVVNGNVELELLAGAPAIRCQVDDWRALPPAAAAAGLLGVRAEMARRELRLDAWPWLDLRVSLWLEGGEERARVHYNHNNFFIDGAGLHQLLTEVEACYGDPAAALPPPLELSYRDAVLGLERAAESPAGEASRRYWLARLPGLPPPPPLPQRSGLDRRRRSRLEGRAGELDRAAWEAFKSKAGALGVTPSNAVIAAYACVIATWSNADRFILSQMVTRRFAELHPDLPRMLGNFASLYPLEIEWRGEESFADNARRVQAQVMSDLQHLRFGGMRVLQELNRLKGAFGTAPNPFVVGSGLFLKGYRKASFGVLETSQTVLDHQFFELADGSHHYVWDLLEEAFPAGMIDAMWEAYGSLLRRLALDDGAWRRAHFDLLAEGDLDERRERNRTAKPFCRGRLHEPLWAQAAMRPQANVLAGGQGGLLYGELAAWSGALAAELQARGIGRGRLVPVVMDRGPELMAAVHAVLATGAAYVPVDPRLPRERRDLLLRESGSTVALAEPRYAASLDWPPEVTPLAVVRPQPAAPAGAANPGTDRDLAYVIYTSGSTGRPKGVMIDHRGAWNTIADVNERFAVGPSDRLFGVSAFNFDLSVYDLFGTLAAGACLVYPEAESALDPGHWLELAVRERITIWSSVPALMSLLVEAALRHAVLLPALRLVLLSGDKIPLDLPAAIRRVAPGARVVSLGGATEASIWSILYPIDEVDPGWATIPYGYPMANQTWQVRDRHGRPCPTWVAGELWIGGAGLALGYWQDAAKTDRSFVRDASGERLYRTGDLGRYLPGGCLEWLGRVDFQVKIQGQRIELGEIEAALAEHPAVRQAVVAVQEAPATRHRRLVAFVVPREAGAAVGPQLTEYLRGKLPSHMVPTAWQTLAEVPLTANGKVDRQILLASPAAPEGGAAAAPQATVPPGNAVEARLLAIWQRFLGAAEIGVTDDFFALGGQSFDAIRIFAVIKDELGRAFTLNEMWRARTIRELARRIARGAPRGPLDNVVPIEPRGLGDPLFLVHPAGGSVMGYSRLGRVLGRPLYGIEASTAAEGAAGRRDIPSLAAQYVAAVRRVQPRGPYSLGGWSSGAMIAFAMASQLEAAGEPVRQVFLLDGPTPARHGDLSDGRLLRWFLDDLALGLPVERLDGAALGGLPLDQQLARSAALLGTREAAGLDLEQLLPAFEVFRDLVAAGSRYEAPVIDADLTVIRVADDVVDEFAAHPDRHTSDWGWSRFTRGRVHAARVPGNHHSFLGEALVGDWCNLLRDGAAEAALAATTRVAAGSAP